MRNLFSIITIILLMITAQAADRFKVIKVVELEKLMADQKQKIYLFDANVESTRTHVGIIPGAKLVSADEAYDLKKDLPVDKKSKLIFYCANHMCTASHAAAERAIAMGYTDVSVMIDGVYGWKKVGQKLVSVSQASPERATPQVANVVTPQEAFKLAQAHQAIIVDVREEEERHEIIENSKWMPMSRSSDPQAWSEFVKTLPQGQKIIFHCATGFRSKKIAEKLAAQGGQTGYFQGPDQWRDAGLPLKPGPAQ